VFKHRHPYKPFIKKDTTKLIVGTLPPPRFSVGELLEKDVNFCYGSYYNSLWLYIDKIYNLNLKYNNSNEAIQERKNFLITHKIGVCDIVESCVRDKIDASDLGMKHIILRDVIGYLKQYPKIETLLFTGGNSKNGPEYFFRKHIKNYGLKLELVNKEVPRMHQFNLDNRMIKTISLTSASGSANRAIGSMPLYQQLKNSNPNFTTFDFRVMQYRAFF
jgi:G:T/U-mismatch repair DNA glycosylase